MKKRTLRFVSCIMTLSLTIALLNVPTKIMGRKESDVKYRGFFEQQEDFDVLFLGSSHVINAVFPMELYHDYGIVSYNFGGHANCIPTSYWVMENALEYTMPKVIVFDCYGLGNSNKATELFSFLHQSFDAFPCTVTKVSAVCDLLNDPYFDSYEQDKNSEESEPRSKSNLLWDYPIYHSRWNQLTKEDFVYDVSQEKGSEARIGVYREDFEKVLSLDKQGAGSVGEQYLVKAIESCEKRGIKVVLTYLPFVVKERDRQAANYLYDLASEYDVDYINFLDMNLIDMNTDLYDDSHLNPSGARKVTDYLGDYLMREYALEDHRDDGRYEKWHYDYDEYVQKKNGDLATDNTLTNKLMLVCDDDLDVIYDIRNKDLYDDEWFDALLANARVDTSKIHDATDFIVLTNCGENVIYLDNFRTQGACLTTDAGEYSIRYDDANPDSYELLLDSQVIYSSDSSDSVAIEIAIYRDGEIIDDSRYEYELSPYITLEDARLLTD